MGERGDERTAREPSWVAAILDWRWSPFFARLALVGAYLVGGIAKASDWPSAVAEQAHFGLHPAALWATLTIAIELIGSILVLTGRLVWLGAGMLGIFTLLAAIVANGFWALPVGSLRNAATNAFLEHIGLVGGFVAIAILARREPAGA